MGDSTAPTGDAGGKQKSLLKDGLMHAYTRILLAGSSRFGQEYFQAHQTIPIGMDIRRLK